MTATQERKQVVEKEKDIFDRIEDINRKVRMAIEVSLRLIESEKDPVLSESAACGFNHFCYETLDELNLILEECWHKVNPKT